ncbi:MAG: sulfatase [Acidobacteria bacterium]|nr:sulfatase [Acidobacteriota bacterium]
MAKGIGRREMFGLLGSSLFAQPKRPNILFIYTDDHSYRTVSCYPQAYKWVKTPAIDKLASEGVRFEHAYISTWCMPSRTMLLTGRHPHMAESMRMEGPYPGCEYDPVKCPFWPADFRKKGYFTGQIGKWHTGTDTGFGRDWDYQLVWNRPKFTETSTHYYYDQPITYHGGKTEILKRYSTDQYADWASEFIRGEGRDKTKPWYLWMCIGAVHGPYTPAERHLNAYPGVDVDTPKDIFPPRATKPDWAQKISQWNKDANGRPVAGGKTFNEWVRQYHQGVNAIDEAIEKVIKTLEETGQRENTLIVFTADQGLAFGQHGFRGVKVAPYDANIRAPFIISMPSRLPSGKVCKTPVGGIDIPATIYSFAGLKTPWEFQGRDLTPLLKNPDMNWPHPVMIVATGQKYGSDTHNIPKGEGVFHGGVPWYVMLRDKQYKYIRPMIEDLEELYDLDADPDELNNLAIQPAHRARLLRMRAAAIAELKKNKAGFVDKLPAPREVKA